MKKPEKPALGLYLQAKGSKSFCMRLGKKLEREQGIKLWTVALLNKTKGIWGLYM